MLRLLLILLLATGPLPAALAADGKPEARYCHAFSGKQVCIGQERFVEDVCGAIDTYADHYGLPPAYFARLIWQESRFQPFAISPAGAQGIAQFMPGTARLRALDNPFDPAEALERSADYLKALETRFGNLGLAAAAYNGGEQRVSNYLAGKGGLAGETRAYVSIVTGRSVEGWVGEAVEEADFSLDPKKPFAQACTDMANAIAVPPLDQEVAPWQPWGVLIAQNFSPEIARTKFDRAKAAHADVFAGHAMLMVTVLDRSMGTRRRHSAQVGFPTRAEANRFCNALLADGGNCIVQRNRN
ncbi:lytic transglycosylase domain-containing protein [Devosia sp. PTR5]|uniref:Lytic transglycosylase domain-containing protein n=1 Tax=Devosia oryzisoli TaxID=2774138 RepID=A0A927IRN0_9HYPH|nr:lytic transglycosylase domain-containing protein [Devosia oryzisoli]MBD8066885.1 lytic transglycosylase domain-containing protein [Devosia oryzisoli]